MMDAQPKSYRDLLDRRGMRPIVIERTVKVPGHRVLTSWAKPVEVVRG